MSRPAEFKLCIEKDLWGRRPAGVLRRSAEIRIFGTPVQIDIDVTDRRARLVDIIPLARQICNRLMSVCEAATASKGETICCKKGCDACCDRFVVGMSEPEAFCLIEDIKRQDESIRNRILGILMEMGKLSEHTGLTKIFASMEPTTTLRQRLEMLSSWWTEVHCCCPMLQNHQCSLYAYRPMVCREFLAVGDCNLCSSWKQQNVEIPVPMYDVLMQLTSDLEGESPNLIIMPTLLQWYSHNIGSADVRTWRAPAMAETFLEVLCRKAACAETARLTPSPPKD